MIKAKLVINNKEIEVEISEEELKKFEEKSKKTGYERVEQGKTFCFQHADGNISVGYDHYNKNCDNYYETANYYSDDTVAENNIRADKLMRQLRRFAAEHKEQELDWKDSSQNKYYFYYNHDRNTIEYSFNNIFQEYRIIYFDSEENARLAVDTFRNELFWYFTEYKDSL